MADSFPVYRKYPNNLSYFKINSTSQFDELKIMGKSFSVTPLVATIHPDRILINDMLTNEGNYWIEIDAQEFNQKLIFCRKNLNKSV